MDAGSHQSQDLKVFLEKIKVGPLHSLNSVFVQLLRQCSSVPYAAFTLGGKLHAKSVLRNPDFVTDSDFKW